MNTRSSLLIGLTIVAATLGGCASTPRTTVVSDPAADRLASVAAGVQANLQSLAEAEQYERAGKRPGAPVLHAQIPGLTSVVTMPYHGPLEPAVTRLVAEAGARWQVKFVGRVPTLPIVVRLDGAPGTIGDKLYSIGVQAGTRADVVVDPEQQIIAVMYANAAL